ncbi:unnamed protein product, partial [Gulo gulo]
WRKSAWDVCDVFLQLLLFHLCFGILWEIPQENLKTLIFQTTNTCYFSSCCLLDFLVAVILLHPL